MKQSKSQGKLARNKQRLIENNEQRTKHINNNNNNINIIQRYMYEYCTTTDLLPYSQHHLEH